MAVEQINPETTFLEGEIGTVNVSNVYAYSHSFIKLTTLDNFSPPQPQMLPTVFISESEISAMQPMDPTGTRLTVKTGHVYHVEQSVDQILELLGLSDDDDTEK